MATVKAIIDFLLVLFKVLDQVPEVYDRFKQAQQDAAYKTYSAQLDAAYNGFIAAKAQNNHQAMLDAAWAVAHKKEQK